METLYIFLFKIYLSAILLTMLAMMKLLKRPLDNISNDEIL